MKTFITALAMAPFVAMAANNRTLDDSYLKELMKKNKAGLIYVWSPRMPLSVQGLEEARRAAADAGIAFVEARDPHAGPAADSQLILNSNRLLELGVSNHFPTIAFFKDGKVLPTLVPGYESREQLGNLMDTILSNHSVEMVNKGAAKNVEVSQLALTEIRAYSNPRVPEYFYKVRSNGLMISYSSDGTNYLFDLANNSEITLPGVYDPVFNLGTDTMLFPMGRGYNFHSLKKWRAGDLQPLLVDETLLGVYQSAGLLKAEEGKIVFRVISEQLGNHLTRDYSYSPSEDAITPLGDSAKTLCSNFSIKLPIISKNGLEVGGVDLIAKKTSVWKIISDGTCEKVEELSLITGKLNFSYDSRFVTYHIYATDHADYETRPDSNHQANVYVYDRQTKKTYQITNNIGLNSMYPDFTQAGELVFADYPHSGDGARYRFLNFQLPATYVELKDKILQSKCIRCHSAQRPQAGVALDTHENVMKLVVPGKPEESLLFEVVNGGGPVRMPLGPPLPQADIDYIRAWIQAGAIEK